MMAAAPVRTLNFVVTGGLRSGAALVGSTLANCSEVVCHFDLLAHNDAWTSEQTDAKRRTAHEAYFGTGPDWPPAWFSTEMPVSPHQYLAHIVFDNPRRGEGACGAHLSYPTVCRWELHDLFAEKCREGDFCLIHVVRNPVAAYISLVQAERSKIWTRPGNAARQAVLPPPITLDSTALTAFCREHATVKARIMSTCEDALVVSYEDLCLHFQAQMRKVFAFLELPDRPNPARPGTRRLLNRPIRDRVANWAAVRTAVSSEVRALMDVETLV